MRVLPPISIKEEKNFNPHFSTRKYFTEWLAINETDWSNNLSIVMAPGHKSCVIHGWVCDELTRIKLFARIEARIIGISRKK